MHAGRSTGRGNAWTLIAVSLVVALTGCGRRSHPTATIAGAVKIDGMPVTKGGITFTPRDAGAGTGAYAEIIGGRYRAERVPIGRLRAMVIAVRATGRTVETSGTTIPEIVSILPPQYDRGIDIEVSGDSQACDFDLSSTP